MRITARPFLLLIIGLFINPLAYSQVGINTKNPLGLFHIDPLSDTKGTPVSPTGDSDDVIVTNNGKVGIGTAAPAVRLDVRSTGTAAHPVAAFRLRDGSQSDGKVLGSSIAPGIVSWQNKQGAWIASLTGGNLPYNTSYGTRIVPFTGGEISGKGTINPAAGTIRVPNDGTYRISISGYSSSNRTTGYYIVGYFFLMSNAKMVWGPHSLGNRDISVNSYVSYIRLLELKAGDTLQLLAVEHVPGYANAVSGLRLQVEFVQKI